MSDINTTFPQVSDLFARRGSGGCYSSIADNIDASGDCWEWTGTQQSDGYGQVGFYGRRTLVHRLMWEALVGPIPPGLEIDHLCRNARCVNPDHLEPVTSLENSRRGFLYKRTHCRQGHRRSGDNIYTYPDGTKRACKACQEVSNQRKRAAR